MYKYLKTKFATLAQQITAFSVELDALRSDPARFETIQEYAVWRLIRECPDLVIPERRLEQLNTIDEAEVFIRELKWAFDRLQNFITPWDIKAQALKSFE